MVNTLSFTERKRVRKNFGKLKEVSTFPNLIEIQKNSYDEFLLEDHNPSERPDKGPLFIHLKSLEIFINTIARFFNSPET